MHIFVIVSRSQALRGAQTEGCVMQRKRNTDTWDDQTKAYEDVLFSTFTRRIKTDRTTSL
jgi:hypothetical protein